MIDRSAGIGLPPGWTPFTTYWLLDDDGAIVGMSRLRHALNDGLLYHGGHIGYYVRPSARGKRYGTSILELTLAEGRKRGIERFLLTVNSDNVPRSASSRATAACSKTSALIPRPAFRSGATGSADQAVVFCFDRFRQVFVLDSPASAGPLAPDSDTDHLPMVVRSWVWLRPLKIVDDDAPNAFAIGAAPPKASVTFTTGLLARLNDEDSKVLQRTS